MLAFRGMKTVGVHEAKTRFSQLLRGVEGGEEVVVTRAGAAVARIVPMASEPATTTSRFGLLANEIADPGDWEDEDGDELGDLFASTRPPT